MSDSVGNSIQGILGNNSSNSGGLSSYIKDPRFFWSLLVVICIVLLMIVITKTFKYYVDRIKTVESNDKRFYQRSTISHVVVGVIRGIIIVGGIIVILQINGINVTSLVAGVGIASAIIGFALQDAIKDIICGFHIFSDRYFEIGDVIKIDDMNGEIIKLSLRCTKIRILDSNNVLTIANRSFDRAEKLSSMFDIDVPLSYEEDPVKVYSVMKMLCETIENLPGVETCIFKGTQEFAQSAILYKIRYFCNPKDMPEIRRSALKVIQYTLLENKMQIPYIQIDVHEK